MLEKDLEQCQRKSHITVQQWTEGPARADGDHECPGEDQEGPAQPQGAAGSHPASGSWHSSELDSSVLHARPDFLAQRCAEAPLSILSVATRPPSGRPESEETRLTSAGSTASANLARQCRRCQQALTDALGIPPEWWSRHYQNANGYFGCLEQQDLAGLPTIGASPPEPQRNTY